MESIRRAIETASGKLSEHPEAAVGTDAAAAAVREEGLRFRVEGPKGSVVSDTVTVESESDFRGVLGVDDSVRPGPLAVRVRIELAAPDATEDQLRELVQRAEARSPVRDALMREVSVITELVPADGEAPRRETASPQPGQ
jgi:OsmC-like protein